MRASVLIIAVAVLVTTATAARADHLDDMVRYRMTHLTCEGAGDFAKQLAFAHVLHGYTLAQSEEAIRKNHDPAPMKKQQVAIARQLYASSLDVNDWQAWIEGRCVRAAERRFYRD